MDRIELADQESVLQPEGQSIIITIVDTVATIPETYYNTDWQVEQEPNIRLVMAQMGNFIDYEAITTKDIASHNHQDQFKASSLLVNQMISDYQRQSLNTEVDCGRLHRLQNQHQDIIHSY